MPLSIWAARNRYDIFRMTLRAEIAARPAVTREDVLATPCATCSAASGEACDFTTYTFALLGIWAKEFPGLHTRRYLDATAATEAKP